MLKKIFISSVIAILSLVVVLPTAFAGGSYLGANGKTYYNSDFEMTTTPVIYAETMYKGWGRFCIEPPTQYYEGFAFYSTEGDFVGDNYTPQYMSKNTTCFVHPSKFTTDKKISVKIYPYIALESGANKFIQPGYIASATFKADEGVIYDPITLTGSSSNNNIYIDWAPLSGLGTDFDYYQVHSAKGSYETMPSSAGYWHIKEDYHTHDSLKAGDWWSYQVTPVKWKNGAYVEVGFKSKVIKVQVKGPENVKLSTPTITYPSSDTVFTNYPRKAYIQWTPVTNATKYEVHLDWYNHPSWTDYNTYESTNAYITTPALSGDNDYRVRVRALNNDGSGNTWSDWSSYAFFKYDISGNPNVLPEPTIYKPTKDAVLTAYPRETYLEWSPIYGATKYEISLACDVCTSTTTKWLDPTTYTTTNAYYTTPALPGDNEYRFKVRALDNKGESSPWSELRYFRYDTSGYATLSAPTITAPDNNEILTNYPRKAYLKWTEVSGAQSYEIDMEWMKGSWTDYELYTSTSRSFTTPALSGNNKFRFKVRAVASNGKKGTWSNYSYFSYSVTGTEELSLWIGSWSNGLPKIGWGAYSGTFDGYAMFVAKGFVDENKVTEVDPSYFSKTTLSHQMSKMYTNTDYTVRILPYKIQNNLKVFIYPGTSVLHFTTGDNGGGIGGGGDPLPPAGYEDEVITNFDIYQNPFADTDLDTIEGWAAAELYRRGVIGGYPDGEFKGYREVNRAEIAKFLLLARYGSVANVANNGIFKDVKDGEWYTKFVVTAALKGIISGYPDGTFKPKDNVNTVEFLKMLNLTFKLKLNLPYNFKDVKSSDWFAKYAGIVEKYNLFPNKTNYLSPGAELTRNEIAVAIYQYLKNK